MGSSAVKEFHLFPHFPKINNKKSSPLCSKLVFPRIPAPTPLKVAANDHQQGQNDDHSHIVMQKIDNCDVEEEDDDEDGYEYDEDEEKLLKRIYNGKMPERLWTNMVYWDMDTAPLPRPELAPQVFRNIASWLGSKYYLGPVKVVAYGDKNNVPPDVWDQLEESTGEVSIERRGSPPSRERVEGTFALVPTEVGVPSWCYILTALAMSTVDCPDINRIVISDDERIKQFGIKYLYNNGHQVFAVQPWSLVQTSSLAVKVIANVKWMWEDVVECGQPLEK